MRSPWPRGKVTTLPDLRERIWKARRRWNQAIARREVPAVRKRAAALPPFLRASDNSAVYDRRRWAELVRHRCAAKYTDANETVEVQKARVARYAAEGRRQEAEGWKAPEFHIGILYQEYYELLNEFENITVAISPHLSTSL